MYGDLDRPPLRQTALARALAADGWHVEVVEEVSSTNAVVADRARAGEPAGLVVVAEQQTAGRGRLDRSWVSPPRAGLTFSALLRPTLAPARWGWLPLLAGVAVARTLRDRADLDAVLKWPNDVLVDGRKVCGVLTEVADATAVVVGIGLNVTTRADELPHDQATSVGAAGGATTDRDTLLRAVLRQLTAVLAEDDPAASYRGLCSTIGQPVRLDLPAGRSVTGTADTVDDDGRLVVDGVAYAAGDVVHLRPTGG